MAQFISFKTPCRPTLPEDSTEEEQEIIGRHFQYLKDKLAAGELILAGRTQEPPYIGISIFEAVDRAAAEDFVAYDPAVAAGVFKAELQTYGVALLRGG